mgnify:CR=1 FL=1
MIAFRFLFELIEVVDYLTAEETGAVLKSRLVNNHLCTFCLDTFHDALNRRLTKLSEFDFIVRR